MRSIKLNKGKNRKNIKMTTCKMCHNAGVRGRSSRSSRSSRSMMKSRVDTANRLFNDAFNSAVIKPVSRVLCCQANSDPSVKKSQIETEKLREKNKLKAQAVRQEIGVDPRVASAFEQRFGDSNLTIGKKNKIKAIREPTGWHSKTYDNYTPEEKRSKDTRAIQLNVVHEESMRPKKKKQYSKKRRGMFKF